MTPLGGHSESNRDRRSWVSHVRIQDDCYLCMMCPAIEASASARSFDGDALSSLLMRMFKVEVRW